MEVDRKPDAANMPPPPPPVLPIQHVAPMRQTSYDPRTALPTAAASFTSPQSKRNLEIIAEAIRHLEGDSFDSAANDYRPRSRNHASEESLTESSPSDQEDGCKSDSSGRNSPARPPMNTAMAPPEFSVRVPQTAATLAPLQVPLNVLPIAQLPQSTVFNFLQLQRS